MINLLAFFQEFTFDTLIAVISCIAAIVALFLGGKAYQNCQIKNNKFGGKKVIKDESDDHSQTAENITNNTYNGLQVAETTALLSFTHATFKECMDEAHKRFEQQANDNLQKIIEEANRIVQEKKLELAAYTKIDWINIYFESAKNSSDEYMQNVWAKVLAREMEKPGSFSFKTLEVLKSMDKNDFMQFEKMCSYKLDDFLLKELFTGPGFSFSWINLLKMSVLGTIHLEDTTRTLEFKNRKLVCSFGDRYAVVLSPVKPDIITFDLDIYVLSSVGKELFEVAECEYNEKEIKQISLKLRKIVEERAQKQINTSLHKVNFELNGQINYQLQDLLDNSQ